MVSEDDMKRGAFCGDENKRVVFKIYQKIASDVMIPIENSKVYSADQFCYSAGCYRLAVSGGLRVDFLRVAEYS